MKKITSIFLVASTLVIISCRQQDEMSEIDINTLKAIEKSRTERIDIKLENGNTTPISGVNSGDPVLPPRK